MQTATAQVEHVYYIDKWGMDRVWAQDLDPYISAANIAIAYSDIR